MAALEAPVAVGDVVRWQDAAQQSGALVPLSDERPSSAGSTTPHTGQQLLTWARERGASAAQQYPERSRQRPPDMRQRKGCPPHGAKAVCGARPKMEDAYTAVPFLLEVPVGSGPAEDLIPPRIAPQVRSVSGCLPDSVSADTPRQAASLPSQLPFSQAISRPKAKTGSLPATIPEMSPLHFFGVFDGHGGAEAALLCARTLHERLAEALGSEGIAQRPFSRPHSRSHSSSSSCTQVSVRSHGDAAQQTADSGNSSGISPSTSADMDVEVTAAAQPAGLPYTVNAFEQAFTEAFSKVDEEFGEDQNAGQIGTTAVVALVGDRQLYVGNCGDSRAVLCRAGTAIPLTEDHKAARDDETARVEGLGGEIMWWNGERVMGVLAVSRAIGDHFLRPFVIAKPEVTIISRSDDDDLLLLASDGLWDVMSNQDACSLAQRCLRRAQQRGANRQTAARVAASVLTRAAIDQGSGDNVTVVVVDLSRPKDSATVKSEEFFAAEEASPPTRAQELEACHTGGTRPAAQASVS